MGIFTSIIGGITSIFSGSSKRKAEAAAERRRRYAAEQRQRQEERRIRLENERRERAAEQARQHELKMQHLKAEKGGSIQKFMPFILGGAGLLLVVTLILTKKR